MPLHEDTHTRVQGTGLETEMYYLGYAPSVKLKAKAKQCSPDIVSQSMPLDHPNSRELNAAHTRLLWKWKTKTRPRSRLFSFPANTLPHADWREAEQDAAPWVPLSVAVTARCWQTVSAKARVRRPVGTILSARLLSSFLSSTAWGERATRGVKRRATGLGTRTCKLCVLGPVSYHLSAPVHAEKGGLWYFEMGKNDHTYLPGIFKDDKLRWSLWKHGKY